eukprot:9787723-Lingulodinium_polyedra.AAC.1
MVFARSTRLAKTRGDAALECVPERISEQLSRESCPEMRSGTHAIAAVPHIFAKRALHASTTM